jgi:ABC-type amino acid transport substrate-binding protein
MSLPLLFKAHQEILTADRKNFLARITFWSTLRSEEMSGLKRHILVMGLLLGFVPALRAADVLDQIRKENRLLWGGDQEGGGPYIFPREDNPAEVTGFEVELAARLGDLLKVRSEFSQGQWDKQPDLLRTGKIHIILNGYEFTPVLHLRSPVAGQR